MYLMSKERRMQIRESITLACKIVSETKRGPTTQSWSPRLFQVRLDTVCLTDIVGVITLVGYEMQLL